MYPSLSLHKVHRMARRDLLHIPTAVKWGMTSMLWQLAFSLFGVTWVIHYSVKENVLSWHGSFVGKRAWKSPPYVCLDSLERREIGGHLRMLNGQIKLLNTLFMASFLEWIKPYIDHQSISMIRFVDWLC